MRALKLRRTPGSKGTERSTHLAHKRSTLPVVQKVAAIDGRRTRARTTIAEAAEAKEVQKRC
jgi:hypothetical protein